MDTLSLEDSRELLAMCKAGKLYQVEDWIRQGKSIRVHPKSRDDPLNIALRKGFFSLVELLARNTDSQEKKDEILLQAIRRQTFDIVKMLVDHGANPKTVPLTDVLCAWDPEMMRYFFARGVDMLTDDPFTHALGWKIETVLGVFLDCRQKHPTMADDLQRQLDMALAVHCREGDEKWVAILMWAGGNPYARVRDIENKKYGDNPLTYITGAEEAARKGHLKVLEKLELDASHPDAQSILYEACAGIHEETVHYLLRLGINPNDKKDGGSSALDAILIHIDWGKRMQRIMPPYDDTADKCLKIAKDLIKHKARWTPDACRLRATRRAVCQVGPQYASDLVSLLRRRNACSDAVLEKFVGSSLMQDLLKRVSTRRY